MNIKVLIISNDYDYKHRISLSLKQELGVNTVSNLSNIISATSFLNKSMPNAIIIDGENQVLAAPFVDKLINDYNLLFIICGFKLGNNINIRGMKDYLHKPAPNNEYAYNLHVKELIKRIRNFASRQQSKPIQTPMQLSFDGVDINSRIIAIAASTGGTEALPVVLKELPANCPPVVIVQHMPAMFTKQFADRLDKICAISVSEAVNGDFLRVGHALVAPGDFHMRIVKRGMKLAVEVFSGEKMHGVRPAADIMFNSIAAIATAKNTIGVILTGMGADGAKGLYEIHSKGAKVIGQDKDSCVVYGMPKVAFDIGAVDYQVTLKKIGSKIVSLL